MGASFLTHPLDTVKVRLQTQGHVQYGFYGMAANIVRTGGFFSLYSGISAALMMSGTYSTIRFAFYEAAKERVIARAHISNDANREHVLSLYQKMLVAGTGGAIGSLISN
jgi:hypothetical protein